MQDKIQAELGLNPVEQEVIVLYDGEKGEQVIIFIALINDKYYNLFCVFQPSEFWKGKRVVEMEKPRPMWFSKNLMQKSTQPAATTKEIKPDDLG